VCKILQEDVIIRKDANQAHRNLMRLPGIVNYLRSLRTPDEREHFERHLRKYINMYLPECPFEVCTTNRYTILTHEACVVARRRISPGEPIRFLTGIQVEMTEKEEEELSSRTDFSIVISSRRKRPSLFLGPARFANHDCDSNARLATSGPHGINIVARKHIEQGDEITVQYGDNYFGEDNCECLCASCEKAVRNGWDPKGPVLPDSDSDGDSGDETEGKASRGTSVKAKPTPATQAKGALKRKRDQETMDNESEEPNPPKKRGRWPKKTAPEAVRSVKKEPGNTTHRTKAPSSQASQNMMADWFARRSNGELELDEIEDDDDDDDDEQEETLDDLHEQFQIQKKPAQGRNSSGRGPSKKRSMFGKMLDMITGATAKSMAKLTEEIEEMNGHTAGLMQIGVADVPRHYRRETRLQTRLAKAEVVAASSGESSEYEMKQVEMSSQLCPNMPAIFDMWAVPPDPEFDTQGAEKTAKVTDKFAQSKSTPKSMNNARSKSNLRNVLNADDDDASDIYEVPESPPPEESATRPRGRPRKSLQPINTAHRNSSRQVEAAQHSTDSSSMSSVFSTEGVTGEASSLTSTEQSPDRLDGFVAGNISQNIIEMYTTEPSPVNEDWEEERKLSDQRLKGWSRGRLPTRKSTRRNLQEPPSTQQALDSIEPATEVKKETDEDSSSSTSCKRGPVRTPGDFHLTTALLCTPYHRWVECRNCDDFFVQAEAYLTRIACPRCERHSKLYGFHWPKTDREGKHDAEERVLDHRTIHRFIDPEDERMEKKGKKGLAEVVRERETSSRMGSEGVSGGDGRWERLRSSPRRSESRRKTRSSMPG
jgi:histone-lysine N-methyltransferase SUV420H